MSKHTISRTAYRYRQWWFRLCRALAILIFLGTALVVGFVGGLFASVAKALPRDEALANIRPPTPTRVLANDGTLLARVYLPDQNREVVPLSRMGRMIDATIAIEDVRFYDHPGVDLRGILRALVKNVRAGDTKEGASTITQQLARNLFLSRERKIERKLREAILALELERRYSKDEILETYLNQVLYGSNRYGLQSWGAQMAARNYFNKNVEDLTLAQAALLAGLPKNPRDYSPYRYPKRALQRRDLVLSIMLKHDLVSPEDYRKAKAEPLKLAPEKKLEIMANYYAPYFVRNVLTNEMKRIFGQDANDLIYHYGIDIYTSLDPRMQKVAELAVTEQVKKNKFRRLSDGALISIDPQTGFIKALVGGIDYGKDQYDIVTQGRRQPGSAFKPFIYTAALMNGYTPTSIVHDSPHSYPTGYGRFWSPKNSDGRYMGAIQLRLALWLSRNLAAAEVAHKVGIKTIIPIAYRMGIKHPLEPHLSTALGASVVVPLEICSAYGTLANHGIHHPPTSIKRVVTQDGEVLYEYHPNPQRAIPANVADNMKEIMRGAIERGTGRAARCPFPASGKTGTTNSYRDAWFVGYTDDLVTAVWVGNRNNQEMNRTFGGTVPAPIWRQYMLVAHPIMAAEHKLQAKELAVINNVPEAVAPVEELEDTTGQNPDEPADPVAATPPPTTPVPVGREYSVAICADTGELANQYCPEKVMVTYVKGSGEEPPGIICSVHTGPESVPNADGSDGERGGVLISICAETSKIASDQCPTVLLRRFKRDAPTETCPLHGGQ
ncbi:MAG: transglycosylase domain-containing protein [Armatimonadota bacterium]